MTEPIATAFIAIRPDGTAASFQSQVEQTTQPALASLKKGLASLGVGLGVGIALKQAFGQLKQEQEVAALTNVRLQATGDVSGVTAGKIKQLAQQMQDLSGINRTQVQSAENVLLSFTSIRDSAGKNNDIFTQTVKLSTDLARAMGVDVTSAAQNLGRALQNPTNAGRALRAVNVILTKSQTDMVKSMEASGQTLEAQKYILGLVKDRVGGAAKAYGETLPGQLDKAKASLLELGASILSAAAPALTALVKGGSEAIDFFESLPGPVKSAIVVLGLAKVAATTFGLSLDTVAAAELAVVEGATGLIAALGSEVTLMGAVTVAAAGAAVTYNKVADGIHKLQDAQAQLVTSGEKKILGDGYDKAVKTVQQLGYVLDDLKHNMAATHNPLEALADSKAIGAATTLINLSSGLVTQSQALSHQYGLTKDSAFAWLTEEVKLGHVFGSNSDAIQAYGSYLKSGADITDALKLSAQEAAGQLEAQANAIQSVSDAEKKNLDPIFAYVSAQSDLTDAQKAYNDAVKASGPHSAAANKALLDLAKAAATNDEAQRNLASQLHVNNGNLSEAKRDLDNWVASGALTRAEADKLANRFLILAEKAKAASEPHTLHFYADITDAEAAVARLNADLKKLDQGVIGAGVLRQGGTSKASVSGNTIAPGGQTSIAEAGFEIVHGANGESYLVNNGTKPVRIDSHGRSENELASGGQPAGLTIVQNIYGTTTEQAIEQANRKMFFQLSNLNGIG